MRGDTKEDSHPEVHVCNVNEDGICGMHKVEVERRNYDRNRIEDLKNEIAEIKKDFKEYKKNQAIHIGNLCTFKNRTLGASVLGLLVITGSYVYTYSHQISTDARHFAQNARIEAQNNTQAEKNSAILTEVGNNRTNMAVLVSRLDTTNDRLKEVITLMEKERNARKQG